MPDSHVLEHVTALVVTRPRVGGAGRVVRALASGTVVPGRILVAGPGTEEELDTEVRGLLGATSGAPGEPCVEWQSVPGASTISQVINGIDDAAQWLWILHDDSVPAPTCLERLAYEAERSERIGAAGPKQVDADGVLVREVGIRATRSARRVPEIDEFERDQGQYDDRTDVLAVGTAGMLLRRQAAAEVDWFDPALGPFGEGLEMCRRLRLAGWRIAVVPQAVLHHERASLEAAGFGPRRWAQMYNAVVAAPSWLAALTLVVYVLLGPLRAAARLVMKEPGLAGQELAAVWHLVFSLGSVARSRRRVAAARKVPRSAVSELEEPARSVRKARREARRARAEAAGLVEQPDPITLAERMAWRRSTWRWGTAVVVLAAVLASSVFVDVLGRPLTGGALLPDAWSATDIWQWARSMWLPSGDGYPAPVDALWILLSPAVLLTRTLGALCTGIVVAALPMAALSAFVGLKPVTNSPHARAWGALIWAVAPPLVSSVMVGHVAGIVWHVSLPMLVRALAWAWTGAVSGLGCAALLVAYMTAAAPMTLVVAGVFALVALVRTRRVRWLWLPVPAVVALLPTIRAALNFQDPWRVLLSSPGVAVDVAPSGLALLALDPTASSLTPASYAMAALGFIAFAALFLRRRNGALLAIGACTMTIGWAWAALAARAVTDRVVAEASYQSVHAWTGCALSLAAGGLTLMLVSTADGLRTDLRARGFGVVHIASLVVIVVCIAAPGVLAGIAAVGSHTGERQLSIASDQVPAVGQAGQEGDKATRTLRLTATSEGIRAQVLRGNGREVHETSMVARLVSDAADADLATAVASLAGDSSSFAATMRTHAIDVVVVAPGSSRQRSDVVAALQATRDVDYVASTDVGDVWRVSGLVARATVGDQPLASEGPGVEGTVSASTESRVLSLAERADAGWSAYVGETKLAKVSGWNARWTVPASLSGPVSVEYDAARGMLVGLLQAVTAVVALVVALPVRRRR